MLIWAFLRMPGDCCCCRARARNAFIVEHIENRSIRFAIYSFVFLLIDKLMIYPLGFRYFSCASDIAIQTSKREQSVVDGQRIERFRGRFGEKVFSANESRRHFDMTSGVFVGSRTTVCSPPKKPNATTIICLIA